MDRLGCRQCAILEKVAVGGRGPLPIGWCLIRELGKVKDQPMKLHKGENYANALEWKQD